MKKSSCFAALFGLCLFLIAKTPAYSQTFTAKPSVSINANTGGFYEYLPVNYQSSQTKYPLIIFVHGLGELGDGTSGQLSKVLANGTPKQMNNGTFPATFQVNGNTYSFLAIIPQFKKWPAPAEINSIIDYAIQNYRVDTDRIYLTGLSMGGGVVWDYVGANKTYADRIAAILPICGASSPTTVKCENIAQANIAVWATHNSGDGTVSVNNTNGYVSGINTLPDAPNPLAKKSIFSSSSHDAWSKTYDLNFKEDGLNAYEWMLTFQRNNFGTLPDEDLSLIVRKSSYHSVLEWTYTGDETYSGFYIERSKDGKSFDSIGYVSTASGTLKSFKFEDMNPYEGRNYYRVKGLKNNGRFLYSKVKNIILQTGVTFKLYPNPVAEVFNINTTYEMNGVQLVVTDMAGRRVMEKTISGSGNFAIPIQLPKGIYSAAIVEKGDMIYRQSFVKQ